MVDFNRTAELLTRDVPTLAREAEEAGAPPQGHRLVELAEALASGDLQAAVTVRDQVMAAKLLAIEGRKSIWPVMLGITAASLAAVGAAALLVWASHEAVQYEKARQELSTPSR